MKQIDHVMVIGDTTAGRSGNPKQYNLTGGEQIKIPTTGCRKYNGTENEWNVVIPDILVTQTADDIKNNRDLQMEYAINYLNN